MSRTLSRRTVLRGLGAAMALPCLDAMLPHTASAAAAGDAPLRLAFFYVPNGIHMPDWKPTDEGNNYKLPSILEPLAPVKNDFLVLTGLAHNNARALGDGPGDHARSVACFLTGCHPRKTSGADIKAGISVDQFAAGEIGDRTRLASLELGIDRGAQSGNCDSGYSCAYSSNISWRGESTPAPKEINPRLVFDRLFGSGDDARRSEQRRKRDRYRKSILDLVAEDGRQLKRSLGAADVKKMDEYLESVRDIEKRIVLAEEGGGKSEFKPSIARPSGAPGDYEQHAKLMLDLMVLAFQSDQTRIISFMYANAGSNRSYPNVGVRGGHHSLSHHGNNKGKQAQISKINRFHMQLFAEFLQKLRSKPEGDGNLLDNSLIVYGSAIGDGNRHNHHDLPVLLAGRGGGTVKPGRHVVYDQETPLMNLYLAMVERAGVDVKSLGDSSGHLSGLEG